MPVAGTVIPDTPLTEDVDMPDAGETEERVVSRQMPVSTVDRVAKRFKAEQPDTTAKPPTPDALTATVQDETPEAEEPSQVLHGDAPPHAAGEPAQGDLHHHQATEQQAKLLRDLTLTGGSLAFQSPHLGYSHIKLPLSHFDPDPASDSGGQSPQTIQPEGAGSPEDEINEVIRLERVLRMAQMTAHEPHGHWSDTDHTAHTIAPEAGLVTHTKGDQPNHGASTPEGTLCDPSTQGPSVPGQRHPTPPFSPTFAVEMGTMSRVEYTAHSTDVPNAQATEGAQTITLQGIGSKRRNEPATSTRPDDHTTDTASPESAPIAACTHTAQVGPVQFGLVHGLTIVRGVFQPGGIEALRAFAEPTNASQPAIAGARPVAHANDTTTVATPETPVAHDNDTTSGVEMTRPDAHAISHHTRHANEPSPTPPFGYPCYQTDTPLDQIIQAYS